MFHSRYRLQSPAALDVLNSFIIQLYHDENNVEKLMLTQTSDIYEMIWSHSQFLEIMLATSTESTQSKDNMKGVCVCVCRGIGLVIKKVLGLIPSYVSLVLLLFS